MPLRRRRTAFALYALLLVLPTLVLGGLQWRQITLDRRRELRAVPVEAKAAADRLCDAIEGRFRALIEEEERRPFYHYAEHYVPPDQVGVRLAVQSTPLLHQEPPTGALGWFCYERSRFAEERAEVFVAAAPGSALDRDAVLGYVDRYRREGWVRWAGRVRSPRSVTVELAVAAVSRGYARYRECLEEDYASLREEAVELSISRFHVVLYRDDEGELNAVATRRIWLPPIGEWPAHMECLDPLRRGFALVQGFFIDPDWLFDRMPRTAAASVLSSAERFYLGPDVDSSSELAESRVEVLPIDLLQMEVEDEADQELGRMVVARSAETIESRFAQQRNSFFLLAAMLLVSLGTGMWLLLSSVSRDLAQARERENFVDAVTHELRTPLAAIRLLGEMLLEGWTVDPATQREYHSRIVRETKRLSTLVERVLAKARITRGRKIRVEPADLSAVVEELLPELESPAGGQEDLVVRLAGDLPAVLLDREALSHVLINLVENARKYAPVDPEAPAAESILVETALRDGRVVLEVADRGPGVPPEERERIFEAFYRVGSEATRSAQGTGLGLHLVRLFSDALGARVSVSDRPGGGALFRVTFRPAPHA